MLDTEGNKAFVPDEEVDPQTRITSQPLSPEMQRAVDEHVHAAITLQAIHKRDMVRHCKMDARKSMKASRKRAHRTELSFTPFLVIGAYQALVRRMQKLPHSHHQKQQQKHTKSKDSNINDTSLDYQVINNILNADISFSWFQMVAEKMAGLGDTSLDFPKKCDDVRMFILHETLAMLMRPLVAPYLPPHAWFLSACNHSGSDGDDYDYGILLPHEHKKRVEGIARDVEYDTKQHTILLWDLAVDDGKFSLNATQLKMIMNLTRPYVSNIWHNMVCGLFNKHSVGPSKKTRKWTITDDKYSCLPSLLTDMLLLSLDYSTIPGTNPLYSEIASKLSSDKRKQKLGVVRPRRVAKKVNDLQGVQSEYFRFGTAILISFKGPLELQSKLQKAVGQELKATLSFDRRLVNDRASSIKKFPGQHTNITQKEKTEMQEAELAFAEEEKKIAIAAAGTKRTRNSARSRLQEEGRVRLARSSARRP